MPTRVAEMWGRCRYTRNKEKAFDIAHKWANRLPVCEYGVRMPTYNKTWKHIVEDAMQYAQKELKFIKDKGEDKLYNIERLQEIADGSYFK